MKNIFLLAASMLIAFSVQSQIVYTDVNPDQTCNTDGCTYNLDLNNDGVTDFTFSETKTSGCSSHKNYYVYITPPSGNAVANSVYNQPLKLSSVDTINSSMNFLSTSLQLLPSDAWAFIFTNCVHLTVGNWANGVVDHYAGLRMTVGADNYYGWVRLDIPSGASSFTVKDYAYNSAPNQSIVAGQACAPTSLQATILANGTTSWCQIGGSVVLSVAAAGFNYQWKKNGHTISGATLQSYTANAPGNFNCDVSNNCGTITSNTITLIVYPSAPSASQAKISGASSFCTGESTTLSVAAAGLNYHWKKNGANISGATNQTYTAKKAATYTCDVGNACGITTSNSIVVTENPKPKITFTTIECSNGNLIMTVRTSPPTGVTYQWWKKGPELISGATDSTYIATEHTTYWCVVTIIATGCSLKSGQVVFSSCKEISGGPDEATLFKIYPNPSSGVFNFEFQSDDESETNATIEIRNELGQVVFQKNYSLNSGLLQEQIDLGSLHTGVYYVSVKTGEYIESGKILIQ